MNLKAAITIGFLAAVAIAYHVKELKRYHDSGFETGWTGGVMYANGEFEDTASEDEIFNRVRDRQRENKAFL